MRLEKFFSGDVQDFFTVNNVTAKPGDADRKLIEDKITGHMANINKNAVPLFYATKVLNNSLQLQPNQKIANLPEYDIIIHANKPKTDEHIELFYLDWQANSTRTINLKSEKTTSQPLFFMTAMMNGCSLDFKGDRQAPLISHMNAMGVKISEAEKLLLTEEGALEADYDLRAQHMTKDAKKIVQPDPLKFVKPQLGKGLQPSQYRDVFGEKKAQATSEFAGLIEKQKFYKQKWNTNKRIEFLETRIQCYGIRDVKVGWTFYMSRKLIGTVRYREHFYSKNWKEFFYFHILPPVEIFPDTTCLNVYKV
ncbi:MAG: hypothetical protein KKC76_20030 [Proteobacteria bacterium]|nr:hypothetical protein [Pseudomonadota bacterium]MBU4294688.1 hypothetical protein [Pseudomonadota bacterium]MCG2748600.1 hypothetical protein [Desulfobulbaceae bacterium]